MLEKFSHAVGADGYQRVLVLAPLPKGRGGVPSAAKDVQTPQRRARAELIVPDTRSAETIGPNIYDPARRAEVALVASSQGMLEARPEGDWQSVDSCSLNEACFL
jgi:NTE family protein